MKLRTISLFFLLSMMMACAVADIVPVQFTRVHIADNFWRPRIDTLRAKTIRYALDRSERAGYIRNFEYAGRILSGEAKVGDLTFQSIFPFDDAEVFKILEGAAYLLQAKPDPAFEARLDSLIDIVCSAQEPDGYLYTNRTIANPVHSWVDPKRWASDWNLSHETFNAGELHEAGVAYYLATGKDKLLKAAIRNADLICKDINPEGMHVASGHQVIEMALIRLYEVTGDERYLDECLFFLDCRGERKHDPSSSDLRRNGMYWQDHLPLAQQREAVGHAVRALYCYSAMADVVRYRNLPAYREAIDAIWDNIVSKKFYITGGLGAWANNEAFGGNYDLPNSRTYCETCAAIANCMFNLRMFRLYGDAKYIDVLERSLYNCVLDGISVTGDAFYYPNLLEVGKRGNLRSPWFDCSCCPTNLCRLIPSVPGYVYATDGDNLYVNLFTESKSDIVVGSRQLTLSQHTRYPWEGNVRLTVDAISGNASPFAMRVRIPGWAQGRPVPSTLYRYSSGKARGAVLRVNGKRVDYALENGYAVLQRAWAKGDVVEIDFPMEARMVTTIDSVTTNRGLCAVERGPIVYCAEFADNNGSLDGLVMPVSTRFAPLRNEGLANGVTALRGTAKRVVTGVDGKAKAVNAELTLVPYFARAYRGKGAMKVWLPTSVDRAKQAMTCIDHVDVAEEKSEAAHNMKGKNTSADGVLGWRHAIDGWFEYTLRVDPKAENTLVLTYWGADGGNRRFRVLVDGTQIAAQVLTGEKGNGFTQGYENDYVDSYLSIPARLTQGKRAVCIRIESEPGSVAGGVFGVKTIRNKDIQRTK